MAFNIMKKLDRRSTQKHDVAAIITLFGGDAKVAKALKQYRLVEITPHAVKKWRQRGAVPASRLPDLMCVARRRRLIDKFNVLIGGRI